MPASLRELRQRRRSVESTKKITKAMELIAASRIVKAQQRAQAAEPYSSALFKALSAVSAETDLDHPLLSQLEDRSRAAMLLITSDRGQAGAYAVNAIRHGESLYERLKADGLKVDTYLCGRKGAALYEFRGWEVRNKWVGFSEEPTYAHALEIAEELIARFLAPREAGGVDEIHIVYTKFVSMITQRPEVIRVLPLEVVEAETEPDTDADYMPIYEFEPSTTEVLDRLLPLYVANRIHYCLLQSAASEIASRQRAMKSATDNAEELIRTLTRQANQARQAGITQEITEIVGGAGALAESADHE